MRKLVPGLAIGLSLTVFPLASAVIPASAMDQVVTVTIGGAFADSLSVATGIAVADLPVSMNVPRGIANNVCDVKVSAGATCEGVAKAKLLVSFLDHDEVSTPSDDEESASSDSDDDSSVSSSESSHEPNDNSASALAPGHLKGDGESAKSYAPGQNKQDGGNASDLAPGHQKSGGGKVGK